MADARDFNQRGAGHLPGHLGIVITRVNAQEVRSELPLCLANLPEGASGFTTIELKSNHLGTALDGTIECTATPVHLGRATQVWDAVVTHRESGKTIALFRCTQMVLYPKAGS